MRHGRRRLLPAPRGDMEMKKRLRDVLLARAVFNRQCVSKRLKRFYLLMRPVHPAGAVVAPDTATPAHTPPPDTPHQPPFSVHTIRYSMILCTCTPGVPELFCSTVAIATTGNDDTAVLGSGY